MDDYIDRQAAIDALDKEYRCTDRSDDWDGLKTAMLIIENLPSAQPERKTGTWIAVDYFADGKPAYREWECSACGCVVEDEKPTGNFCKMCGADMRGKQDE